MAIPDITTSYIARPHVTTFSLIELTARPTRTTKTTKNTKKNAQLVFVDFVRFVPLRAKVVAPWHRKNGGFVHM